MIAMLPALAGFAMLAIEWMIHSRLRRMLPDNNSKSHALPKVHAGSAEYYRLYKYLDLQAGVGARPEDSLKRLYLVTQHRELRLALYRMSEVLTNSNEIRCAIETLRPILVGADGQTFLTILENIRSAGLRREAFARFDRMLFQKYLIDLAGRTKRMKRKYFTAVFLFCAAIFGMLFLPMVQQMIDSLQVIFR